MVCVCGGRGGFEHGGFCQGVSVSEAQKIGNSAHKDGLGGANLLASIGSYGKYLANAERDFHRRVHLPIEPYKVQTVISTEKGPREATLHVLLPHELAHQLYAHEPSHFHSRFLSVDGVEALRSFGQNSEEEEWFAHHPDAAAIRQSPTNFIPVRIHGDDAPLHKTHHGSSMYVLQWTSCMCRLSSWLSRCLMVCMLFDAILKNVSLRPIWRVLIWSFDVLASGVMPSMDHDGEPLTGPGRLASAGKQVAGGFKFILCQILGDWKFMREEFQLARH